MPLFKIGDRVRFKPPRLTSGRISPFFSDAVAVVESANGITIEGVPDAQVIYLKGSTDMWHSWDLELASAAEDRERAAMAAVGQAAAMAAAGQATGIPIRRRLNLRRPE